MEIIEKLEPTNVLYHGLAHFLTFKRFDEAYKRLGKVLKSGAILSRKNNSSKTKIKPYISIWKRGIKHKEHSIAIECSLFL